MDFVFRIFYGTFWALKSLSDSTLGILYSDFHVLILDFRWWVRRSWFLDSGSVNFTRSGMQMRKTRFFYGLTDVPQFRFLLFLSSQKSTSSSPWVKLKLKFPEFSLFFYNFQVDPLSSNLARIWFWIGEWTS